MNKRYVLFTWLVCMLCAGYTSAQSWSDVNQVRTSGERLIVPAEYRTVETNPDALWEILLEAPLRSEVNAKMSAHIIELPAPDGSMHLFSFVEAPVMAPALQARYPNIRSYSGQGITDPTETVRFSMSFKGLHAMVISNGETWYIDPYETDNTSTYISYTKSSFFASTDKVFWEHEPIPPSGVLGIDFNSYDQKTEKTGSEAKYEKGAHDRPVNSFGQSVRIPSGTELRTYRLALACTGEYAQYHGGTIADVNDAYNTSLTRVNGVYEREVDITMVIVANNDNVIFLNGGTDPYTNNSGSAMLNENQSTCDANIGSANYDIGHVYSTGGGGIAQLQSPCGSGKARGVTGQPNPIGDPFDIDYVCHEMGHQYGGNHTQNNSCNRASSAAYEPGSAATIMGYAGICPPNLQSNSDDYFHIHSIQEMLNFSQSGNGNTCPVITPTGNGVPTIEAGPNYTIPHSTPFELTATGSDPDGDIITYTWEEHDLGPATASGDNLLNNPSGNQPTFRSWKGTTDPTRVFPRIQDLVNNTTVIGEHIPDYGRTMNFWCSVRDNRAGGGGINDDEMFLTLDGNSGPFVVSVPNGGEQLPSGGITPVSWDVAGTDVAPVSCATVDIYLSTDGGFTYPTLLLANTPNDGSETVTLPTLENTNCRIKIKGNGNVFFDISNGNFEITGGVVSAQYDAALNAINEPEGFYCGDEITPSVNIVNLGTETLTSADVEIFVDAVSVGSTSWTGSLPIGGVATVNFGPVTSSAGPHVFTATVSNPNGEVDENPGNDSADSNFELNGPGDPNAVTFTFLTDCWGAETSWTLQTQDAVPVVIDQVVGGTYANLTSYSNQYCLADGCYDLIINDSYGDGVAGSIYGSCGVDGDYSVVVNGTTEVSMINANFGSSITESFCATAPVILGCTDPAACNYDPAATADDGSCELPDGCTDPLACNYNAGALCDDGSCILPDGCTNATACNYDPAALCDDGSCILPDGCTDNTACNYDPAALCDDGSCILPDGCTDNTACNYDPAALCDDGSCILPDGCTDNTACNYDPAALCDDGSCILPDGCTDNTACNYDPAALCDDGSCILPDGCTDNTACNYDPAALCDDGSCEFTSCSSCFGDLNNDGSIGVGDLLIILADFGCTGDCTADLNDDSEVGTGDILSLLAIFGSICP